MNDEEKFKFGVRHLAYNAELRNRRIAMGFTSQVDLSTKLGLGKASIGSYETFKAWPERKTAEKIATFLGSTVEIMFPEWLRFFKLHKSSLDTQYDISEKLLPNIIERFALPAPSTEEEYTRKEMSETVDNLLDTLKPREKQVIKLRFGIDEVDEGGNAKLDGTPMAMDLEHVGRIMGVTRERIRQIEAKALRKLKHPTRKNQLKGYL